MVRHDGSSRWFGQIENLLLYGDGRRDTHLRQGHLTLHDSRPGGVRTAAGSGSLHQRQEGRGGSAADADLLEGSSPGSRHRGGRPGHNRVWRHLRRLTICRLQVIPPHSRQEPSPRTFVKNLRQEPPLRPAIDGPATATAESSTPGRSTTGQSTGHQSPAGAR